MDAISDRVRPVLTDVTTSADDYPFETQHFAHHLAQLTVDDD